MTESSPAPSRRSFLGWITGILGTAAGVALGTPIVGYLLSTVWRPQRDEWVKLDAVDQYPMNETRLIKFDSPHREPWDGAAGRVAAYVRRRGKTDFLVFAVNCAHLGCPVSWFPQ